MILHTGWYLGAAFPPCFMVIKYNLNLNNKQVNTNMLLEASIIMRGLSDPLTYPLIE